MDNASVDFYFQFESQTSGDGPLSCRRWYVSWIY